MFIFFLHEILCSAWVLSAVREKVTFVRYRPPSPSPKPGSLTVAGVVVQLRIGLDVHGGARRHPRHAALQLRVDGQVSVLVDATEPLLDDQLAWVPHEGHLCQAGELASWKARSVCHLASGKPRLCPPETHGAGRQGEQGRTSAAGASVCLVEMGLVTLRTELGHPRSLTESCSRICFPATSQHLRQAGSGCAGKNKGPESDTDCELNPLNLQLLRIKWAHALSRGAGMTQSRLNGALQTSRAPRCRPTPDRAEGVVQGKPSAAPGAPRGAHEAAGSGLPWLCAGHRPLTVRKSTCRSPSCPPLPHGRLAGAGAGILWPQG